MLRNIYKIVIENQLQLSVFNKLGRGLYYFILRAEHLCLAQEPIILQEGLFFKNP